MNFIITNIDKIHLLQTLYAHAEPKGFGQVEASVRNAVGDNILGLTEEECKEILSSEDKNSSEYLVDYCKGKPLKLGFRYHPNGDIIVSATSYDLRNGKYRFFEALLNTFDLDEIVIVQKSYPSHLKNAIDEESKRPKEQNKIFENILKATVKHTDNGRIFWTIDTEKIIYVPPFLKGLI
jgi:hypothetical protein